MFACLAMSPASGAHPCSIAVGKGLQFLHGRSPHHSGSINDDTADGTVVQVDRQTVQPATVGAQREHAKE